MTPCKVCSEDIPIAAHGIKAIVRHSGRSKHLKKMPKTSQPSILASYATNNPKTVETMSIESSQAKSITRDKTQTVLVSSTSQHFVFLVEIMWCLDVIMTKYSYNRSSNKSDLLSKMFSSSNIAKYFACGKTKCSYIVKFRLSPYFLNASHYVALFDECYNNAAKENQMDVHIRYWDFQKNIVLRQFYGPDFLGKSSAKDILHGFETYLGTYLLPKENNDTNLL